MKAIVALAALLLLLAACTALPGPGETPGPPASPAETAPAGTPPAETPPVATPPLQGTFPPFDTEVPQDVMEMVVDEAAVLGQVGLGEVQIVRAEAVTWSDASLGCPEADQMYAQVLTDGYWIVLEAGGTEFDFRMAETGIPRLCPPGQGQPPLEEID